MNCERCKCPINGGYVNGPNGTRRHPAGHCPDIARQLQQGLRAQGSELTAADVGRSFGESFGAVLPLDVGKRVWRRSYGLTLEGADQRDARKNATQTNQEQQ